MHQITPANIQRFGALFEEECLNLYEENLALKTEKAKLQILVRQLQFDLLLHEKLA